jgi:hypothetical protein
MSDGDHIRLASITTAVDGSKDGYWTLSLGSEELDCTADLSTQKGEHIVFMQPQLYVWIPPASLQPTTYASCLYALPKA